MLKLKKNINDLLYLDNVYVSDLKSHISECIDLYMNENISSGIELYMLSEDLLYLYLLLFVSL